MKNNSIIISQVAKILMPFILVFGLYIVIGGADSVGGGFQGGAVLSAIFILRYLISPDRKIKTKILQQTEKILMIGILLLAMYFLGTSMNIGEKLGEIWMIFLNLIIAIKVCCGLSIIFFRYVFYEGR
jgi:multicomponent Na+:H+ antiporter subunit B